MIRFCLKLGLVLAVVAAAAVYVYTIFAPQYEARALLWIDSEAPYLVHPRENSGQDFVNNQLGLIRSSLVLGPVASQPAIAHQPGLQEKDLFGNKEPLIDRLAKTLDVSKAWGTEHFHIKCTTTNAASSAAIVNAVAKSYFDLVDEYEAGRTRRLIELLEREREAIEREVERLRENVRQMTIVQTGEDPLSPDKGEGDEKPASPLGSLERQLTEVRGEQAVVQAKIFALEEAKPELGQESKVANKFIEEEVNQDPFAAKIQSAIAERRFRIVELELEEEADGEDADEESSRLGREIQLLENKLSERRKELQQSLTNDLNRLIADRRTAEIIALKEKLSNLAVAETALLNAYQDELKQVKQFTGETLDLKIKKAELERAEEVLDRISGRAFLLRTEQRAPPRVELLERATVPTSPVKRGVPLLTMILASLVGFFTPLLIAMPIAAVRRHNQSVYQALADEALLYEEDDEEAAAQAEEDDDLPPDQAGAVADAPEGDYPKAE